MTDPYDYEVECCECGKTVKYCDTTHTMEPDTGYTEYYCSDCYNPEPSYYDYGPEAAWEKEQQILWECYADYLPYTEK